MSAYNGPENDYNVTLLSMELQQPSAPLCVLIASNVQRITPAQALTNILRKRMNLTTKTGLSMAWTISRAWTTCPGRTDNSSHDSLSSVAILLLASRRRETCFESVSADAYHGRIDVVSLIC